nr:outer membrane protein assembly factor BamD [Varunaivibrio sulfuroxidans]
MKFAGASVVSLLILSGCSSFSGKSDQPAYKETPVATLYNNAADQLQKENYAEAAKLFDEVERQHPYSVWATKAQLMAAYSLYMHNRYDQAINALDRFIQLHPANKDVPYAYYLKGLCYYEQISDVARDQQMTENAYATLKELIARFPTSPYARDAKVKLDLTRDHMAGKEMEIGRYYLRKGEYLAAINRFKRVIDEYQTTTHTPEALLRLVEAYWALGLKAEARKVAAVLGYNFPGSTWYGDAYRLVGGKKIGPTAQKNPWYKFW